MTVIYRLFNGSKEKIKTQIDNERDRFNACFPTSMINVATIFGLDKEFPTIHAKTGGYKQAEDAFDWFMHNDKECVSFVNKNPAFKSYALKDGNDIRELWDVEVFSFNKWIGREVCKVNYNFKLNNMAEILNDGKGFVTSLKYSKFTHVISVVGADLYCNTDGSVKNITQEQKQVKEDFSNVENVIIADSYGDINEGYSKSKADCWSIKVQKEKFLDYINKDSLKKTQLFYGIVFNV